MTAVRRKQLRQLGDVRCNAPASSCDIKFSAARRPGSSSKINVGDRLSVTILHDETRLPFFDGPGQREAAGLKINMRSTFSTTPVTTSSSFYL
jgi:hypothetical protein